MKTFTVELEVGTKKAIKNIGDLEDEIEKLSNELKSADFGSDEFKRLSTELIKAQKQIKNTELSLESLDSEQVASEFGSVVGAVGDMTGAMVLLGGTGGAVEETAENIEKAIGISMAFKGAIEGVSSGMKLFNNIVKTNTLLQKANNTINVLAAGTFKVLGFSVETTSAAFKGLRGAMIATGIGALVVAVGLLIANFDKLKAAITGISQAQKDRVDLAQKGVEAAEKEYELSKLQINGLKLQGKTEEQIVKFQMSALRKRIEAQQKLIEDTKILNNAQVEGTKSWNEKTQEVIEMYLLFIGFVPRLLVRGFQGVGQTVLELLNLVLDSPLYKFYAETIGGEEILEEGKKFVEKAQEMFKPSDMLEGFIGDATEYVANLIFDPEATKEEGDKVVENLQATNAQLFSEMNGLKLTLQGINEDNSVAAKSITASTVDSNNKMVQNTKSTLSVLQSTWAEYYKKQREQREKDLANEIAIMNAKHEVQNAYVAATSSALQSIAELSGEGTKVAKAAALSDIILTTGVGFAQGLDIAQKSAKGTGVAAAAAFPIFYATQIAAVLAMVVKAKNILSKVKAGPSPSLPTSAPSVGGAGSQAPQFNVVGQSGFNQIASALGQQPPVQAFVVAQDVTTAQQLQNNTIQTATF